MTWLALWTLALASGADAEPVSAGSLAESVAHFSVAYRTWDTNGFEAALGEFLAAADASPKSPARSYWAAVSAFNLCVALQPQTGTSARVSSYLDCGMTNALSVIDVAPRHAEGHALLATLLGMRMGETGGGLREGMRLWRHQRAALKHGATNPRVQYLVGAGYLRAPGRGRSPEKAVAFLQRADALFIAETGTVESVASPTWGHPSCLLLLGEALEATGGRAKALAAYRRAAELQPGAERIRQRLRALDSTGSPRPRPPSPTPTGALPGTPEV